MNAEGGNRTRTTLAGPKILSPKPAPALLDAITQERTPINRLPYGRLFPSRPSFATPTR